MTIKNTLLTLVAVVFSFSISPVYAEDIAPVNEALKCDCKCPTCDVCGGCKCSDCKCEVCVKCTCEGGLTTCEKCNECTCENCKCADCKSNNCKCDKCKCGKSESGKEVACAKCKGKCTCKK